MFNVKVSGPVLIGRLNISIPSTREWLEIHETKQCGEAETPRQQSDPNGGGLPARPEMGLNQGNIRVHEMNARGGGKQEHDG